MLTTKTKMDVYKACVLTTLLYGSEAWTLYTRQERRLLRKIQGVTWQDRIHNKNVLAKTRRRLRWLGRVRRKKDRRIPKDTL